ncbi:MAG: twin-arginine translocation signal domain-containing protein, partial [Alsobacter sp.]
MDRRQFLAGAGALVAAPTVAAAQGVNEAAFFNGTATDN